MLKLPGRKTGQLHLSQR